MYACKISSIYTEKIKIKCWISKAVEGNIWVKWEEKHNQSKESRRVKRKESNSSNNNNK